VVGMTFWEVGVAYGVGGIYYDAVVTPNMDQRKQNIMNNHHPMQGVYNPTTGNYD